MFKVNEKQKHALKNICFCDLFAGIGAFRIALESFGAKCVFSSEWDKDAQETYLMNYGEKPFGDITKIDEKHIPSHDILCAGFPCQPFSISGKQLGFKDTRGTLFFDVARIAKYHKPKIILLENVKNFAKHDNGKTLNVVKKTLNEIGYDVFYDIYNASDYGIPQKRERIFFVCFRKDLNIKDFKKPKKITLKKHVEDILLPSKETEEFKINRKDVFFKENIIEKYSNAPIRIGIVNKGGQGERIYSPKGTAITLSAYGGGVGAKTGLYKTDDIIRRLSPRECARLDGFPDSFKIPQNKNIAYKQFGNSIVVDVIQHIIIQILATKKQL